MSIFKLQAAKRYELSPAECCAVLAGEIVELDGRFYTYFRAYCGNTYNLCMVRTITRLDGSINVYERGLSRRVTSKGIIAKLNALTAAKPAKHSTADSMFAL